MPGGDKSSDILEQNYSLELLVCLCMYELLLSPEIKGLAIQHIFLGFIRKNDKLISGTEEGS